MGFPIRKSVGQRPFAPHHSLSQRTTSFIASCRQGIHQMPLGHLIALISNAHLPTPNSAASEKAAFPDGGLGQMNIVERPEFYRDKPNWSCGCKLAGPCGRRRRMSGVSGVSPPHDGNDHRPAVASADLFSLRMWTRSMLVEPDGIEPTTSSLQS